MTTNPAPHQIPNHVLDGLDDIVTPLENLYRDLHSHPELSTQEHRTAAKAAEQLDGPAVDVTTGVGGTGVVGVLRNGDGPTVMLRADMDGLPVKEATGLRYASTVTAPGPDGHDVPVMHACGHDMHVTWLVRRHETARPVARCVARDRSSRCSSPRRNSGTGAQAMIDDKLFERFPKPDVILGQHVMPPSPARSPTAPAHAVRGGQHRGAADRPRRTRRVAGVDRRSRR